MSRDFFDMEHIQLVQHQPYFTGHMSKEKHLTIKQKAVLYAAGKIFALGSDVYERLVHSSHLKVILVLQLNHMVGQL